METVKNIILGLLIGIVICMGFHIHTLTAQLNETLTQVETVSVEREREIRDKVHQDPIVVFERFFDMVLELEARKKMQEPYNRIDEPEEGN